MKSNTLVLSLVLAVVAIGMAWLILSRDTSSPPAQPVPEAPAPEPVPEPDEPPDLISAPDLAPAPEPAEEETVAMPEPDPTDFTESPIAQKWMEEEGFTVQELLDAEQRARDAGLSDELILRGEVRRFLPTHYMNNVQIDDVVVPDTVEAGQRIPVTVRGRTPGSGFEFLRFRSVVQGSVIRLSALGFTREPTSGPMTETTELSGDLAPLPAGEYKIFIPELGPNGSFPFTVSE